MSKRYFGLRLLDILIHVGVTVAAIMVASAATPDEEIGLALGFGASALVLVWLRKRARSATNESSTGEAAAGRVVELEARLAELEHGQGRVLELEERLDFTERILTQQREHQPGRPSA